MVQAVEDTTTAVIEIMQPNCGWQLSGTCLNESGTVRTAMENAVYGHPDWRVRAVDTNGRIIDIL